MADLAKYRQDLEKFNTSYAKGALKEPVNFWGLAGFLVAAAYTGSVIPLLIALIAEALYIVIVPNLPTYRQMVLRREKQRLLEANIAGREKLMIFVGRLMPGHKNPEMASQVFSRLAHKFADWRIEFAGLDIPLENGRTAWHSCEQILAPLAGRYCYHGALAPEGVQALYRRARIVLMPSGFESFGLVALEAMSAGAIPVVSSRTGLPEVVGDAGVVFENGDVDDLQRKLESLMTDEKRQQDLSAGAFRRAHSGARTGRGVGAHPALACSRVDSAVS